jgi:glutaredoxin-like protein NrdH
MTTVYTKPACVQCDATKRLMDNLGIEYDSVDITKDEEAYLKIVGMGYQSVPVVITEGGAWAGFQPDKISLLAA